MCLVSGGWLGSWVALNLCAVKRWFILKADVSVFSVWAVFILITVSQVFKCSRGIAN